MTRRIFVPALLGFLVCVGSLAQAQSAYVPYPGTQSGVTVHARGGSTLTDGSKTLLDVTIEVRGIVLKADQMIYKAPGPDFELRGNVRVTLPGSR